MSAVCLVHFHFVCVVIVHTAVIASTITTNDERDVLVAVRVGQHLEDHNKLADKANKDNQLYRKDKLGLDVDCDEQITITENHIANAKLPYYLDGTLTPCKTRRRRHKKDSVKSDNSANKVEKEVQVLHDSRPILPAAGAGCKTIAAFMLNAQNFLYVQNTVQDIGCKSKRFSLLFSKLNEISTYASLTASHRSKQVRKWRHIACKIYQEFVKCTKTQHEIIQDDDLSTPSTVKEFHPTETTALVTTETTTKTPEAVHVSDTSKVDYMPFMIGDSNYWKDEYEMWFY